jgi:hypothetical protein
MTRVKTTKPKYIDYLNWFRVKDRKISTSTSVPPIGIWQDIAESSKRRIDIVELPDNFIIRKTSYI